MLLEGAQGSLLDVGYGTYPYVTSSHTIAGGACTGLGIGPGSIGRVIGVLKAYSTRVGAGPLPSELRDERGERLRRQGGEYGTVTGRPRRCGWLDAVAARYAVALNGLTSAVITKLDVLTGFERIGIVTGYRLGKAPAGFADVAHPNSQTEVEELPGWSGPIGECRRIPLFRKPLVSTSIGFENFSAFPSSSSPLDGSGRSWLAEAGRREFLGVCRASSSFVSSRCSIGARSSKRKSRGTLRRAGASVDECTRELARLRDARRYSLKQLVESALRCPRRISFCGRRTCVALKSRSMTRDAGAVEAEADFERARQELISASRERRVIEKLKEHRRRAFEAEQAPPRRARARRVQCPLLRSFRVKEARLRDEPKERLGDRAYATQRTAGHAELRSHRVGRAQRRNHNHAHYGKRRRRPRGARRDRAKGRRVQAKVLCAARHRA